MAAADHLGHPAPFAALVAAGAHTERIRLRTYVLNVAFWNPALLAREAASADVLSDGRLELGPGLEPDQLLRSPFVLFAAGPEEAAAELRRRRERFGFSSITTFSDSAEHLARVIKH